MKESREIFHEIGDSGIMVSRDGKLIFNRYTNKIYKQYCNKNKCRYPMVGLSFRGKSAEFVHYLVCLAWMPQYLGEDKEIHHIDLDPENNNVDNLVVLGKEEHRELHRILKQKGRLDEMLVDLLKKYKNDAA